MEKKYSKTKFENFPEQISSRNYLKKITFNLLFCTWQNFSRIESELNIFKAF